MTAPAYAHGEQVLVFPLSLGLLLVLAAVIVALRWHKSALVRIGAAVVLLASNVALWFSPLVPRSVGALAAANLGRVMITLLVLPMAVTAVLIAVIVRASERSTSPSSSPAPDPRDRA